MSQFATWDEALFGADKKLIGKEAADFNAIPGAEGSGDEMLQMISTNGQQARNNVVGALQGRTGSELTYEQLLTGFLTAEEVKAGVASDSFRWLDFESVADW